MLAHVKEMLKDPSVASIAPTTNYCVKQIIKSIKFRQAKVIIEYGPGDGVITEMILKRMRPDALLILVETNTNFVALLRKRFRDPRVKIFHGSAANIMQVKKVLKFDKADYIVSGIPFSLIAPMVRDEIVRESALLLNPSGLFIVYQSLTAVAARKALKHKISEHFETTDYKSLLFNLPPLYILEARLKKDNLGCTDNDEIPGNN